VSRCSNTFSGFVDRSQFGPVFHWDCWDPGWTAERWSSNQSAICDIKRGLKRKHLPRIDTQPWSGTRGLGMHSSSTRSLCQQCSIQHAVGFWWGQVSTRKSKNKS
jgi:hypothetical protein